MTGLNPELISRASRGEAAAVDMVMEQTRERVFRAAVARTADSDRAEDITQEVMVKALRGLPRFRGDSQYGSWVHRILCNHLIDEARAQAREQRWMDLWVTSNEAEMEALGPVVEVELREAVDLIKGLIPSLPPFQRRAVELVDLEGLQPIEAAESLGVSPNSLRAGLCRGRKRLREMHEKRRAAA